jgi:hypothetical protein
MNASIARPIVDLHRQLYKDSCSTSLAEMMLKVGKKVPFDFYELQAFEVLASTGLDHIKDKRIAGVTFRALSHNLSSAEIFTKIKKELDEGRTVGIYLPGIERTHGWIAVEMETDAIALLSKFSEMGGGEGAGTDELWFALTDLDALNRTDCIYYEE